MLDWVNIHFGRTTSTGISARIPKDEYENRTKIAYGHSGLRTLNDLINFSILSEMSPTDYLWDGASKYHRWARIGGPLLRGIFANRCKIFPYDLKYLRNHDVPKGVNLSTRPLDSYTKLPKIYIND